MPTYKWQPWRLRRYDKNINNFIYPICVICVFATKSERERLKRYELQRENGSSGFSKGRRPTHTQTHRNKKTHGINARTSANKVRYKNMIKPPMRRRRRCCRHRVFTFQFSSRAWWTPVRRRCHGTSLLTPSSSSWSLSSSFSHNHSHRTAGQQRHRTFAHTKCDTTQLNIQCVFVCVCIRNARALARMALCKPEGAPCACSSSSSHFMLRLRLGGTHRTVSRRISQFEHIYLQHT